MRRPLHKRIAKHFVSAAHLVIDYHYYRQRGHGRRSAFNLASKTICL